MRTILVAAVCAAVIAAGCGVRHLAPRATPAHLPPSLPPPPAPPPEGSGRLYVDVEDGASVVGVVTSMEEVEETRLAFSMGSLPGGITTFVPRTVKVDTVHRNVSVLCTTPCWIDLPFGRTSLVSLQALGGNQSDLVALAPQAQPVAYRHALGSKPGRNLGKGLLASLPLGLGIAGLVTSPILYAANEDDVGTTFLVGGAILTVIGALLVQTARPTDRAGAGALYPLP